MRYNESKSRKILRDCAMLLDLYGGSVQQAAHDMRDLKARLLAFYGVGPVTVNIFLRELRPYRAKADPAPLPFVCMVAQRPRLDLGKYDRKSLDFSWREAGLVRLRRLARRKSTERGRRASARRE